MAIGGQTCPTAAIALLVLCIYVPISSMPLLQRIVAALLQNAKVCGLLH
jgi:hypothetical protein